MMPVTRFASVGQGIAGDVGDMIVRQAVDGFFPPSGSGNQPDAPQHSQVLRGEGLRHVESVDELVDAARTLRQLEDDGEAVGRPESSKEFARLVEACRLNGGT
jgi:hypothetical protein